MTIAVTALEAEKMLNGVSGVAGDLAAVPRIVRAVAARVADGAVDQHLAVAADAELDGPDGCRCGTGARPRARSPSTPSSATSTARGATSAASLIAVTAARSLGTRQRVMSDGRRIRAGDSRGARVMRVAPARSEKVDNASPMWHMRRVRQRLNRSRAGASGAARVVVVTLLAGLLIGFAPGSASAMCCVCGGGAAAPASASTASPTPTTVRLFAPRPTVRTWWCSRATTTAPMGATVRRLWRPPR